MLPRRHHASCTQKEPRLRRVDARRAAALMRDEIAIQQRRMAR